MTQSTRAVTTNLRIRIRTARRSDTFDKRFDAVVTPILLGAGFSETQPYVFTRPDASGHDQVVFEVEGKWIIVRLGYKPNYMAEIEQLHAHLFSPDVPRTGGFAFLTPKCMTHRPKEYPCQLAAQRDRSLRMIAEGLSTHVPNWLASLRSPLCYADAVCPYALMYVGRANEVAGRFGRARDAYQTQMSAMMSIWETATFTHFVGVEGARTFVYLCLKLGLELDKCERVMYALKFRPKVEPLPSES